MTLGGLNPLILPAVGFSLFGLACCLPFITARYWQERALEYLQNH